MNCLRRRRGNLWLNLKATVEPDRRSAPLSSVLIREPAQSALCNLMTALPVGQPRVDLVGARREIWARPSGYFFLIKAASQEQAEKVLGTNFPRTDAIGLFSGCREARVIFVLARRLLEQVALVERSNRDDRDHDDGPLDMHPGSVASRGSFCLKGALCVLKCRVNIS